MAETLIARTYAEGIRPLGATGQRNHALVAEAVASRFSPAHALLFSEPSPTPDGVAVDWFAPVEGPVRRLDELNAAEQENARARIAGLTRDVLEFAGELKATGQEADHRLAEALENALEIPDGDAIWLVGEQPVLVNWAHSRDIDKAPRGVIRQLVPATPPPKPEIATPIPPPRAARCRRGCAPNALGYLLVARLAPSRDPHVLGALSPDRTLRIARPCFPPVRNLPERENASGGRGDGATGSA